MVAVTSLEPFNVAAQDPRSAKSVDPVCGKLAGPRMCQSLMMLDTVNKSVRYSSGPHIHIHYIQSHASMSPSVIRHVLTIHERLPHLQPLPPLASTHPLHHICLALHRS